MKHKEIVSVEYPVWGHGPDGWAKTGETRTIVVAVEVDFEAVAKNRVSNSYGLRSLGNKVTKALGGAVVVTRLADSHPEVK